MCSMFAIAGVNAAEGITVDEQKIIDALNNGVEVEGKKVALPAEYINQAESFLKTNDVTAAQASTIIVNIDAAKKVMVDNKITDVKDIKGATASEIFAIAQAAAKEVGVTLTMDNTNKTITVTDKDGKKLFVVGADKSTTNPIKDTGDDYTMMFVMTGAIALLLAGAGVVASKKGYFAK